MNTSICDCLNDYIDETLSPEGMERFDAHLADCTGCSDALQQQMRLDTILREAVTCLEPVSAEFVESVRRNAKLVGLLRLRRQWYLGGAAAAALGFSILLSYASSGRYGIRDRKEVSGAGPVESSSDLGQESLAATQALALILCDQPTEKRRATPGWLDRHDDWGGQPLSRRPSGPKAVVIADESSPSESTMQDDPVYGSPQFEARAIRRIQTFGERRREQYDQAGLARLIES